MSLTPSARKRSLFIIKFLGGIGILGWVLHKVDWSDFVANIGQLTWSLFLLLLALSVADRFLMGYKWNLLLRVNGIAIPTPRVVKLYIVSNLLGAFTPGNLGSDAYRVAALAPLGRSVAVLSTVIIERVLGILSLLIFVLTALPFSFALLGADAAAVSLVAVSGLALILLLLFLPLYRPLRGWVDMLLAERPGRIAQKLHKLFHAYVAQHRNRRVLLLFFLLTLVETGFFFLLNYVAARAVGVSVSLAFIFMVMPVVHFILRMPISIQGIGLQEGLFAYALSLSGCTMAQGVIVSLVWRLTDILAIYLPGCLLMCFSPMSCTVPSASPLEGRRT